MKTKLRVLFIFLCLTMASNGLADILTTMIGSSHIALVGQYNGHKVYSVREGGKSFATDGYSHIIINGETVDGDSYYVEVQYVAYYVSHLKAGVNVIENTRRTEKEYLIYGNTNDCTHLTNAELLMAIANDNVAYWEKSKDSGSSWERIECTEFYNAASEAEECTVLYRNVSSTGNYSEIVTVTYIDPVPEAVKVNVDNATKTVDESITFTLDIPDHNYTYQWMHDGTDIAGATASTYHIGEIKMKDAGVYTCRVSNECSQTVSVGVTLTVNKCPQAIDFPEFEVVTYGCDPITLPQATNKGLTISYQSSSQGVATVSGNVVTVVGPGEANIIASQAGNDDYLPAAGVTRTLHVNKVPQTIDFGELPTKTYGDIPFSLPANSSVGLPISYRVINTEVATVSGNTVTIVGAGTTEIIASQEGDRTHYAAVPVTRTLTVNKAKQAITFNAPGSQLYGNPPIKLNSVTDKGLPITYTVADKSVAAINDYSITLLKPGTTDITATQEGNRNYLPAESVTRTLTVGKGTQLIVLGEIPSKEFSSPDFELPPTTDKGLPITYSSDNEQVATINGNTLHITGVGLCNITATQAGNDYYNAATPVTLPFSVTKSYQEITFGQLPTAVFGDGAVQLEASTTAGVGVYFESSDEGVARIEGSKAVITGAGTCYITAKAVSTPNWYDATPVQRVLVVRKASQTVNIGDLPDMTYGDEPFHLSASASSGQGLTFTSSNPQVLFIEGTTARILGAGDVEITASQAGSGDYEASYATTPLHINKAVLLAKANDASRPYGEANPQLTISYQGFVNGDTEYDLATMPTARTDAYASSPVGMYDIGITPVDDDNYSINFQRGTLSILKAPLAIIVEDATRAYGEANPTFSFAYEGLKLSETASKALSSMPVAVTDARTASNAGQYLVTASGASAANYDIAYQPGTLTIEKAPLYVWLEDETVAYGDAPEYKLHFDGWKLGDGEGDLDILPHVVTDAELTSYPGIYGISLVGGLDNNYAYNLPNKTRYLHIEKAKLDVTAADARRAYGEPNPEFVLEYAGFKNGETEADLERRPVATCDATEYAWYGEYPITVSGGYDSRYSFSLHNGVLTIEPSTGIGGTRPDGPTVRTEPGTIVVSSQEAIDAVAVVSLSGVAVAYEQGAIGQTRFGVSPGVYIVKWRCGGRAAAIKVAVE